MNNKSIGNIFKGDKVIWMVFFFLCMISIIEVYSASSSLSYKSGNYMAPVIRHIGLLFLGLGSFVIDSNSYVAIAPIKAIRILKGIPLTITHGKNKTTNTIAVMTLCFISSLLHNDDLYSDISICIHVIFPH